MKEVSVDMAYPTSQVGLTLHLCLCVTDSLFNLPNASCPKPNNGQLTAKYRQQMQPSFLPV